MSDAISKLNHHRAKVIDQLRAAFLRYLQNENQCQSGPTGKPCHSHKCGCAIEMQNYIDDEPDLAQ